MKYFRFTQRWICSLWNADCYHHHRLHHCKEAEVIMTSEASRGRLWRCTHNVHHFTRDSPKFHHLRNPLIWRGSTEKQSCQFSVIHVCENWKTTGHPKPFSFNWLKFRFILISFAKIFNYAEAQMKGSLKKTNKQKTPTSTSQHESRQDLCVSDQRRYEFEPKLFGINNGYELPNVFLLCPLIRCPPFH